jgi:hypothetical protein
MKSKTEEAAEIYSWIETLVATGARIRKMIYDGS